MRKIKINWQKVLPYISCAGVVLTAICAAKSGAKAKKRLEDVNYIHSPSIPKDIILQASIVWRDYILTTAVMALTIGSIITTKELTKREMASLIMLSTASTRLIRDYKRAVKEVVPEKYDEVVKWVSRAREHDVMIAEPPDETLYGFGDLCLDIPFPGEDETLFYDELFDIWFRSSIAVVRAAQYHLNRKLNVNGLVTLAEFYDLMGLSYPDEFMDLGWGEEYLDGGNTWIDTQLIPSDKADGEKYYILSYTFVPLKM